MKIELLKIAARLKRMIAKTEIVVAFSCVLIELQRIFFFTEKDRIKPIFI